MISKEQEIAWRENVVTKKLYSELERIKQVYTDKIGNASQAYKPDNMMACMMRDAGVIEALSIILTAEFADEVIDER